MQIGYLKLKGAALSAWFDFAKTHRNIYEGAFGIEGSTKKRKGATTYYEPVFKHYAKVSDEADNTAKALDETLQEYLTAYFAQAGMAEAEREYTGQAKVAAVGGYLDDEPEMPPVNMDSEPDDDDIAF